MIQAETEVIETRATILLHIRTSFNDSTHVTTTKMACTCYNEPVSCAQKPALTYDWCTEKPSVRLVPVTCGNCVSVHVRALELPRLSRINWLAVMNRWKDRPPSPSKDPASPHLRTPPRAVSSQARLGSVNSIALCTPPDRAMQLWSYNATDDI